MTEKQFALVCDTNLEYLMQDELLLPIIQKDNNKQISLGKCYTLLNDLCEENKRLKQYTKQVLQRHLDGWRGVYNPIDESLVVEINIVKSIAEDLGVDLK